LYTILFFIFDPRILGAFLAQSAKNRAFRYKSSEAPMRFLWAFRCNPLRAPSG
jgi:hypothetical protein